jgi:hypothetical protein
MYKKKQLVRFGTALGMFIFNQIQSIPLDSAL